MTDNDEERLAFRETGRAVISWVLGAEVRDISIKPEEANLKWFEAGYFLNENDTKILEQGSPSNQDLDRYKNQLMVWQAGFLAELMAFPKTQPEKPREFEYVTELVKRIISVPDDIEKYAEYTNDKTIGFLRVNERLLSLIANELLKKGNLSENILREFFKKAISSRLTHNLKYFCKYVSPSTLKIILKEKKFRWSAPSRLNDPFDMQVDPFDFSGEEWVDILHNEYINVITKGSSVYPSCNPVIQSLQQLWQRDDTSREQLEEELALLKDKQIFQAKEIALEGKKTVREFCSDNRVFCVAKNYHNLLMWSHYSEGHKGAVLKIKCIPELNTPLCAATRVTYQKRLPRISDLNDMAHFYLGTGGKPNYLNFMYTKSKDWRYEEEWRSIAKTRDEAKLFDDNLFFPEEIEAVYLGCKMEKSDEEEIMKLLEDSNLQHVEVHKAKMSKERFELEFDQVK